MKIPEGLRHVMTADPEILGGEPCFNGTRVPLDTVIDNLAAGETVERILDSFPSLTRMHIDAVLHWQWNLAREAAGLSPI
jgi:uncharacterized protein (DUF433 family)